MMISIVIPLYNKAPHIASALRSVLSQTVQDFEVIVIDDGSTDDSYAEACSIKDSRISIVRQKNAGVSAARNKGIKLAKGELIAFLDADDLWKHNFLETILRLRKNYPKAGIYATAYEIVYPGGKIYRPKYKGIPKPPWEGIIPSYFKSILGPAPVWTSATVVRSEIFNEVGMFQEGEPLGEDIDMWARIALRYPVAFSNKVCATYYLHHSSSNVNADSFFLKKNRPIIKTLNDAILNEEIPDPKIRRHVTEYIALRSIQDARICLVRTGDKKKTRILLARCPDASFKTNLMKTKTSLLAYLPTFIIQALFQIKQYTKRFF